MAVLQVSKYAGAVPHLEIFDGPPIGSKQIASGGSGTVYGADNAPALVELTAIGGDCVITWTATNVTETIPQGAAVVRVMRGEAVSVA